MQQKPKRSLLCKIAACIVAACVFPVLTYLAGACVIATGYMDFKKRLELVSLHYGFFAIELLIGLAIAAAVYLVASRLFAGAENPAVRMRWLTALVCGWVLIAGAVWVCQMKSLPEADQEAVYKIAQAIARGDAEYVAHEVDNYLLYWPHQLRIAGAFAGLMKLLGTTSLTALQLVNVLCAALMVLMARLVCDELFANPKISAAVMLLCGLFLPAIFLSVFVYGDMISYGGTPVLVWCTLRLLREKAGWKKAVVLFLFALTVITLLLFRLNNLVVIAAVLCVLAAVALSHTGKQAVTALLAGVLAAALSVCVPQVADRALERRFDITLRDGIPMVSYLAMGLHWHGPRAAGWYDGFGWDLYTDNDYDTEKTTQASLEDMYWGVQMLREQPWGIARFYNEKVLTQWAEPTFQSFFATLSIKEGEHRGPIARTVIEEESVYTRTVQFMDGFQMLMYVGALAGFTWLWKHRASDWQGLLLRLLPAVIFLGGFLFQTLWEAKSRYCLTYAAMLLIYAAVGVVAAGDRLAAVLTNSKKAAAGEGGARKNIVCDEGL